MSVRLISAVWSDAPYEGGVLLVLLALADYCNDEGQCWPRVESLAAKARLGTRQTRNVLKQLKADGILSVQTGGGRGIVSRYKLNVETLNSISVKPNSVKSNSLKSATETLQPISVNPAISSIAIRKNRHEPSIEPSGTISPKLQERLERERRSRLADAERRGLLPETAEEPSRSSELARMGELSDEKTKTAMR